MSQNEADDRSTCCGERRDTPYCPQCGAPLRQETAGQELVRHLAVQTERAKRSPGLYGSRDVGADPKVCEARHQAAVARWKRRLEWAKKMIALEKKSERAER